MADESLERRVADLETEVTDLREKLADIEMKVTRALERAQNGRAEELADDLQFLRTRVDELEEQNQLLKRNIEANGEGE